MRLHDKTVYMLCLILLSQILELFFLETSAKTGEHVQDAFSVCALLWLLQHQAEPIVSIPQPTKKAWRPSFMKKKQSEQETAHSPFGTVVSQLSSCCVSFLCAAHPRLGAKSPARDLPPDVLKDIVQLAYPELSLYIAARNPAVRECKTLILDAARSRISWAHLKT